MRATQSGVLDHGQLPDPEGQDINDLKDRVAELEEQIRQLAAVLSPKPAVRG
jgi:hypothetical protein